MICYGVVGDGIVWHGMVWYGMVWYMVWYCMVEVAFDWFEHDKVAPLYVPVCPFFIKLISSKQVAIRPSFAGTRCR